MQTNQKISPAMSAVLPSIEEYRHGEYRKGLLREVLSSPHRRARFKRPVKNRRVVSFNKSEIRALAHLHTERSAKT
jgi:hypothetical protein